MKSIVDLVNPRLKTQFTVFLYIPFKILSRMLYQEKDPLSVELVDFLWMVQSKPSFFAFLPLLLGDLRTK